MTLEIDRELSEQVSLLGGRFSRPRPALGTLEKIAYRLLVSETAGFEKVQDHILKIAELAKKYGVEDVSVLNLFYRLFENYPKSPANDLADSLINKINHYEEMNGFLPNLDRIEWFFSQFSGHEHSGNYGIDAPGEGEVARKIAFQSYAESDDKEPRSY